MKGSGEKRRDFHTQRKEAQLLPDRQEDVVNFQVSFWADLQMLIESDFYTAAREVVRCEICLLMFLVQA